MDLKSIRKNRGLTLVKASEMAGISQSFLTRLEKGERCLTLSTAKKLADVYKVRIDDLVDSDNVDTSSIDSLRLQINDIDKQMAILFEKRMECAKHIGTYKQAHGLEIVDEKREAEVIKRNLSYIQNNEYKKYYQKFIINNMKLSKEFQIKNSSK